MFHKKSPLALLLVAAGTLLHAASADPVLVATPRARAMPATAGSRPFHAANRSPQPVDLATRGYAESEHAVRGIAGKDLPFVTRLLVRRPVSAGRFSGRVIVELLDASALQDTAPLWGYSWEYFLRRGDAWVGVTVSTGAVAALKKFNGTRYAALNLDGIGSAGCGSMPQPDTLGEVMAQVGALLRSSSKENPLLGLDAQRLVAAGHAASGDLVARFAATSHRSLRLGNDEPVFDGFLDVLGLEAMASACLQENLPRGVPFVIVLTDRGDSGTFSGDTDSDGLRVFEVAGTAGARPLPAGLPAPVDPAAGRSPQSTPCREPIRDQILVQALDAVWQQLDDLLVGKQALTLQRRIGTDEGGSAGGGWRLPQVDLPLAGPAAAPQGCNAATGSMQRFDAATLKRLYRSRVEYLRQFNAAVDQAVTDRLLVQEDATALKAAAARSTPAF